MAIAAAGALALAVSSCDVIESVFGGDAPDDPAIPGEEIKDISEVEPLLVSTSERSITKVDFTGYAGKKYIIDAADFRSLYLVRVNTGNNICEAANTGDVTYVFFEDTEPEETGESGSPGGENEGEEGEEDGDGDENNEGTGYNIGSSGDSSGTVNYTSYRRPLWNKVDGTGFTDGDFHVEYAPSAYWQPQEGEASAPSPVYSVRDASPLYAAKIVDSSSQEFYAYIENSSLPGKTKGTLRAQGIHCNIWVADENFDWMSLSNNDNKLNKTQIEQLADDFDYLYEKETGLIGFERGGGTGGDGGVDGDQRIQLFVFDIYGDYSPSQSGGTFGYYYANDDTTNQYSNKMEMFYIDASFCERAEDQMLGTLAHEFQHMINYNQKYILDNRRKEAAVWYNEMLSELTSDVMAEFNRISRSSSSWTPRSRASFFLNMYDAQNLAFWGSTAEGASSVYISYAKVYFFGAYLVHNYGGPELLREMVTNNAVDEQSITLALQTVTGDSTLSMREALKRYGEALVYSTSSCGGAIPEDMHSFDRDVSWSNDGSLYTFVGFDIWRMSSGSSTFTDADEVQHGTAYNNGPHTHGAQDKVQLQPLSLTLHTTRDWISISQKLEVTITRPSDKNVVFYLLVR